MTVPVIAPTDVQAAPGRNGSSALTRRQVKWGLIFISPWIFGFIVFTLIPMIVSLYYSFTAYDLLKPEAITFVGLSNYAKLFTDPVLQGAVGVTVRFALISIPFAIIFPLGLALLVNSEDLFGKPVYRTLFYMPSMIPVVVGVMVWGGVLNSDTGWLNVALKSLFNIDGPRWFQDEFWVLPALTIMGFWGVGSAMLTMLAGLQNVPTELYDASKVDGANAAERFMNVTWPMITPIIFYNLMLAVIGSFQYFAQAYIISNGRGDPNGATMFYNLYLYRTAFNFRDMGYGATLAWAMFIIVLILTIILFQTQKRWVYYAGGETQ
jgi:multiple sugar transport system permease protein